VLEIDLLGDRGIQDQPHAIRFLLYVAITALTRLLIGDVSHHKAPDEGLLYLCGGILLLAFSILVVRYASYRYPSTKVLDANGKEVEEGK
jgi:phosphate starvation-inducible membrane PsiE